MVVDMDNMRYEQVYGVGPLDPREPLWVNPLATVAVYLSITATNISTAIRYHSDPYWLDVNSNPEHKNVTATFVDNYSQIAVDFGKTNSGYLKIGTRFNAMDVYLITADTVPEIVKYVFTISFVLVHGSSTVPHTPRTARIQNLVDVSNYLHLRSPRESPGA